MSWNRPTAKSSVAPPSNWVRKTCSAETTDAFFEESRSTVYTVAWRVRGEWSLLCFGRLVNSVSMPFLSWSSQTMSRLISGLCVVIV